MSKDTTILERLKEAVDTFPIIEDRPDVLFKEAISRIEHLQAKIDMLMLEHCPEEMTPEQMDSWEKNQVPVMEKNNIMWWGYIHQNGSIQIKRWFGDHKDYTDDCEGNEFVHRVFVPFSANSREDAIKIIKDQIK